MMASVFLHPAYAPPMPAIARIMSRFDRPQLEGFIAVALDLIDVMEPDPEREPDDEDWEHDGKENGDGL